MKPFKPNRLKKGETEPLTESLEPNQTKLVFHKSKPNHFLLILIIILIINLCEKIIIKFVILLRV